MNQMLFTASEQTQTLFAMSFFSLVAIAGVGLLIAATVQNAL
jgi:hypothetical protein